MFQNKEQIPFVVPEQQRCTRSRAVPCLTELPLLCLVPGAQRYVGFVVMGRAMQRKDRIVSSPAPMETAREKLQYGFELVSGSGSVPGSIQTPDLSCRVFIVIKFGSDRVKSTSLFLIFSSKVAVLPKQSPAVQRARGATELHLPAGDTFVPGFVSGFSITGRTASRAQAAALVPSSVPALPSSAWEFTHQASKRREEHGNSTVGSGLLSRICLFDHQGDVRAGH